MGSRSNDMVIAVVGSRTYTDYDTVCGILDEHVNPSDIIVSGGAKGADTLAKRYAFDHGLEIVEYLPNWKKHGRRAGYVRNKLIVDHSDILIAFWDGESNGTQHSINLAKDKGIRTYVITNRRVENEEMAR